MMNFLIVLFAVITPLSETSEMEVKGATTEYRFYTEETPHYIRSATSNALYKIDYSSTSNEYRGAALYSTQDRLPLKAGVRIDMVTTDRFVTLRSAKCMEDEYVEWTLDDATFNSVPKKTNTGTLTREDDTTRALGDVLIINTRTMCRLALRTPTILDATPFTITYTLRLHGGLQVGNKIDAASNVIQDGTMSQFFICRPGGQIVFTINTPKLLDAGHNVVASDMLHRMVRTGTNTYTYVKYPAPSLTLKQLRNSSYIDAETFSYFEDVFENTTYNGETASWATVHDSADANLWGNSGSPHEPQTYKYAAGYLITRLYFRFNTSSLTAALKAQAIGSGFTYTEGNNTAEGNRGVICAQKATSASHDKSTYNDFTGSAYGTVTSSGVADTVTSISFNATGLNDLNVGGYTYIVIREYTHDYGNSAITTGYKRASVHTHDASGTSKDPYLYIQIPSTDTDNVKPIFYIMNNSRW